MIASKMYYKLEQNNASQKEGLVSCNMSLKELSLPTSIQLQCNMKMYESGCTLTWQTYLFPLKGIKLKRMKTLRED